MSAIRTSRSFYGWLLVSPFVVTLLVLFVYALARAAYFSFTDYDLFSAPTWVGFKNFIEIIDDPLFSRALVNTLLFSIIVTTLQTAIALLLALAVSGEFFGKNFFRVAFYVPAILSSAAVTLVFVWLYQKNGFANAILTEVSSAAWHLATVAVLFVIILFACFVWHKIGDRSPSHANIRLIDPISAWFAIAAAVSLTWALDQFGFIVWRDDPVSVDWIGSRENVGPLPRTMWSIVIQNTYTTVPTFMLLFLAGLQGVPKSLYEAARIDGANRWQQLLHVTVPQLAPVIFVVVTFGVIGTLQIFDQVALLGDSTPLESRITLAYFVYHSAFPPGAQPNIGFASAAAFVLAGITMCVVYLQRLLGIRERIDG